MPLKIIRQDITKIQCDAIVNPTDRHYSHGGGADADIHNSAGEELYAACIQNGILEVGKAVITPAFDLPCKYVIHTVGPWWRGGENGEEELLRSCYRESLRLGEENKCESIAFPLISSGRFAFPKDRVLRIAVDEISKFLLLNDENDMLVYIVVYDIESYSISEMLFADISDYIDKRCFVNRKICAFRFSEPNEKDKKDLGGGIRCKSKVDACYPSAPRQSRRADYALSQKSSRKECGIPCDRSVISEKILEDMLRQMDKGFAQTLFEYIDKKGMSDVECYKRANVDKKTFSKIKCNKDYRPSKITVISFAIALRLDLLETQHLLNTVGMSLSRSSVFDVIIEYFITTGNYKDIFDVNETLYKFEQATLGV